MNAQETQQLISTIFSLKRIIFEQLKKAKLFAPKNHIQFETILFIARNKKCKMKDIAEFLCITPPSATSMINNLEKKGLINRNNEIHDRRTVTLSLTKKGNKYISDLHKKIKKQMEQIIAPLDKQDQTNLNNIYQKLIKHHKSN